MDLVKEYNEKSHFKDFKDIFESLTQVFMLGTIKSDYKSAQIIHKKEEINSHAIKFIEEILSNDLITAKKDKLALINLLDDLNYRNEILHLMASKNTQELESLKKSSERMGRKFMSSVKK
ncbi:hypothetical protein [Flavobacterium phragmitis]|uniref:Four helix bundle protein n=1 Tax=Flavobacterium phragmitis TaxID=739143 RepID=A0A1I1PJI1_9FLAO|nr:hypothetical protein [Flavobacterium phragmitis]SFD09876.1 hypothetical protein SAMN05216297_104196 [Flavobacterium phragmitis]